VEHVVKEVREMHREASLLKTDHEIRQRRLRDPEACLAL
jgi:hypothetical protein